MASKTTPSVNEATKRRTRQSTAGINRRYTKTPSPSQKLKSVSLNANSKTFNKRNTIISEKKSFPFSAGIDSRVLMLEEINQLETRLENQISKANVLELKTKVGKFIPKNRT